MPKPQAAVNYLQGKKSLVADSLADLAFLLDKEEWLGNRTIAVAGAMDSITAIESLKLILSWTFWLRLTLALKQGLPGGPFFHNVWVLDDEIR